MQHNKVPNISLKRVLVVGSNDWKSHTNLFAKIAKLPDIEFSRVRRHFNVARALKGDTLLDAKVAKCGWKITHSDTTTYIVNDAAKKIVEAADANDVRYLIYSDKVTLPTYSQMILDQLVEIEGAVVEHVFYEPSNNVKTSVYRML